MKRNRFLLIFESIAIAFLLFFSWKFVLGAPTQNPPSGNPDTPINTGSTAQTKSGNLNISGSFNTSGSVGIGTTSPGYKLDVQGGQINTSGGICIAGDCATSWNDVAGTNYWTLVNGFYRLPATSSNLAIGYTDSDLTSIPEIVKETYGIFSLKGIGSDSIVYGGSLQGSMSSAYISSGTFGSNSGTGNYIFQDSSNANLLYIDAGNSRVGVGTIPTATFHASGTARLDLGSDATGDLLYRSSGGTLSRLGIGSSGQVLTATSTGVPVWANASGNISGGGTANYISKWTAGTTLASTTLYDSSGSIGLGTTTPGYTFTIASAQDGSFGIKRSSASSPVIFKTGTDSALVLNIGGADLMTLKSGWVGIGTTTNSGLFTVGSAGQFNIDSNGEPQLAGTGRHSRVLQLNAEYPGATLSTFYGAGTEASTTGSMTSDVETTSGNKYRNYYEWISTQSSLNGYTVAVRVTLPSDFSAWQTNAITFDYMSSSTSAVDNTLAYYIYNEGSGTVVTSATGLVSGTANTWTSATTTSSGLSNWATANVSATIFLRMQAKTGGKIRVGDIKLNYLSKW